MENDMWKPKCVTVNKPCGGDISVAIGEACSYCGQKEFKECKTMNKYYMCEFCTCWKKDVEK